MLRGRAGAVGDGNRGEWGGGKAMVVWKWSCKVQWACLRGDVRPVKH